MDKFYTQLTIDVIHDQEVSYSDTTRTWNTIELCGGDSGGGGGGGGYTQVPQSSTNTTTMKPPDYAEPYFKQAAQQAQSLFNNAPAPFPGSAFIPFNQMQQQGLQGAISASQVPSQINPLAMQEIQGQFSNAPAGQDQLNFLLGNMPGLANNMAQTGAGGLAQTASGSFLNANPYLDQMYGNAAQNLTKSFNQDVLPGIASQFAGHGRLGSTAQMGMTNQATEGLNQQLGQLASNIYGQNYAQERSNQLGAQNSLLQGGGAAAQGAINAAQALGNVQNLDFQNAARATVLGQGLEADPMQRALQQSDLGDIQRSRQQAELVGQMSDYYKVPESQQTNLSQYLANLAGAAGNYGSSTGQSNGYTSMAMQPTQGSSGMGMLGTGMSMLGGLSGGPMGLFSGGLFGGGGMLGLGGGGK